MARKTGRPGRTLVVFFLGAAILYGLVALGGTWKPGLGLDLQGGTRITLIAKGSPSTENLSEARGIIDDRVNGSGVTEAEVTTQGSNIIQVEIPGASPRNLVDTVSRQAQLRFRLVACSSQAPGPCATAAPSTPGAPSATAVPPGVGVTLPPTPAPAPSASVPSAPSQSASGQPANRVAPSYEQRRAAATASPSPSGSASASPSGAAPGDGSPKVTVTPSTPPVSQGQTQAPLDFMNTPSPAAVKAFNNFNCPVDGTIPQVDDNPDRPLVTCGTTPTLGNDQGNLGVKYLLSASAIEGTQLTNASAGVPTGQVNWVVNLSIGGSGRSTFADISQALLNTGQQFAIVLDGGVITSPTINGVISNGDAQITGGFTQTTAQSLATSLKYGSLPIAFTDDPTSDTVGPSLAGDQLSAGITAGIVGLLLVMVYCLLYYRGLGLVVIASLLVAGGVTYAMVLLLSATANFTLSLPGIAGLIVAVGITADSFIVFFERIRDEMREGKSMRIAVEAGWVRARGTCLAADSVSFLAAVVLFVFGAGVVKGFAFALGLSTVIDVAVFFWFTKPMVSYLARYRFFNSGNKMSGLDAEALGVDQITKTTVGSRA